MAAILAAALLTPELGVFALPPERVHPSRRDGCHAYNWETALHSARVRAVLR